MIILKLRAIGILMMLPIVIGTPFLFLTHLGNPGKNPGPSGLQSYLPGQTIPERFVCGARHATDKGIRITCLDRTVKAYLLVQVEADPQTRLIHEAYLYTPRSGANVLTYGNACEQWGNPSAITRRDALTMVHFQDRWVEFVTNALSDDTAADIVIYDDAWPR